MTKNKVDNFFDAGGECYEDVEVEGFGTVRVQEPTPNDQESARNMCRSDVTEQRAAFAILVLVCEDPETGEKLFDKTHLESFMGARGDVKKRLTPLLESVARQMSGN